MKGGDEGWVGALSADDVTRTGFVFFGRDGGEELGVVGHGLVGGVACCGSPGEHFVLVAEDVVTVGEEFGEGVFEELGDEAG